MSIAVCFNLYLFGMRLIFSFLLLVMLAACNNSEKRHSGHMQIEQPFDSSKLVRHILIAELNRIKGIIASSDPEKIAGIFSFPIPDSLFSVYIEDSSYYKQRTANGNRITKQMFLQHFKEISENIWLSELNQLFKHNIPDSLENRNILGFEAYIKTEPCFYSYHTEVANYDSIVLRIDMNSNRQFKSNQLAKDEIPENSSEVCEHSFWWIFRFDGKKLHFRFATGAG